MEPAGTSSQPVKQALAAALAREAFPRSASYDPEWMLGNQMGPNALWLAEAHALTFADGFFDAMVSLDAYHYFGTDDRYLGCYARFVKPDGQLGIVVPGLREEFAEGLPPHLAADWPRDFWSFHSPAWWQRHWQRSGPVRIEVADLVPSGWEHWLRWLEVAQQHGDRSNEPEAAMLRSDAGRNLGFSRIVARKV